VSVLEEDLAEARAWEKVTIEAKMEMTQVMIRKCVNGPRGINRP